MYSKPPAYELPSCKLSKMQTVISRKITNLVPVVMCVHPRECTLCTLRVLYVRGRKQYGSAVSLFQAQDVGRQVSSSGDAAGLLSFFSRSVMSNSLATQWTVACQAPPSMEFSRQEC